MKIFSFLILVGGFLIAHHKVEAQEIKTLRLGYYQEELFINPAFAGSQDVFSANIGVKRQWINIDGAPTVQQLQAHLPVLKNKAGFGLTFENMNYGVSHQLKLNGVYAYRILLPKGALSFGLQMGCVSMQNRYADLSTPDVDREFAYNTPQLWGFNFGIGAYYAANNYYIGLSVPAFFDNTIKQSTDKLNNKIESENLPCYLTGGYVMAIDSTWKFKPALLFNYVKQAGVSYDVSVSAFLYDKYWLGTFVRSTNELGLMAGINLFNTLNVGYAVSFGYGQPYSYRGTAHQITVGFLWSKDKGKARLKAF